MSTNIRFFYNRRNSKIDTGRRKLDDQGKQVLVDFCSMGPLQGKVKTVDELWTAIRQSGGGILLIHSAHGYEVIFADAGNYSPPDTGIYIDGFGVAGRIALSDKLMVQISENERLIIPINADAGKRLGDLDEHLEWLSPDIRSLVFRTLHKPDMDTRVSRLEKLIRKDGPSRVSGPNTSKSGFARSALWWSFGPGLLVVFLIVMLFAFGATYWPNGFFKEQPISDNTAQREGDQKPSTAMLENSLITAQGKAVALDEKLTTLPTTDKLVEKTRSLVERLDQLKSSHTAIGALWKMHITPLKIDLGNPWEKEKWLELLENKGEFDTDELHSHFQWALLKLWGTQAVGEDLRLAYIPGESYVPEGKDPRIAWSETEKLFFDISKTDHDRFTKDQRVALQAVNCRIKYKGTFQGQPQDYGSGWNIISDQYRFSLLEAKEVSKQTASKGNQCDDITTIVPLLDKLLADLPKPTQASANP